MDDFLASGSDMSDRHIVFIGLDGATWKIIDPLIDEGLLPTFARLKREGAWGTLKSVDCYFTPPAWTSMLTGFNPWRTGIYTFGKWIEAEREFKAVSSVDVDVPYVWDIASRAGRRVGVTNVPVTYPAQPVNGIMVSGLMTPIVFWSPDGFHSLRLRRYDQPFDPELDGKCVGPRLSATVALSVSTIILVFYDTTDDHQASYDTVALKVFPTGETPRADAPAVRFRYGEFSPWFRLDYRKVTGDRRETKTVTCSAIVEKRDGINVLRLSPMLRLPSDPDLEMTYPDSVASDIERRFGHYLVTLGYGPDVVESAVEETTEFASYLYAYDDWEMFFYVFMATDNIQHYEGVSTRTREVYRTIDRFLGDVIDHHPEMTLILASDHGFSHYRYAIDLNNFFESIGVLTNSRNIDHDHTLVFHNRWCLYFNKSLLTRDELERRGIPVGEGQPPRDALIAFLTEQVGSIRYEGRDMPVELVDVPQDGAGIPPDMFVIGGYTDYFVEGSDLSIHGDGVVRLASDRESWYHDQDGMYLLWGRDIRRGVDGGAMDITNIAPTILFLGGLPLSEDFDGRVMTELLRSQFTDSATVRTIGDYVSQRPDRDLTFDELESLEEKLRTLGYIR